MDIGSFLIVGVIVSLLVQAIKRFARASEYGTLAIVAVISILASFIYYELKDTSYWQTLINVLAGAGAIYTFIIQRFESKN